MNFDIVNDIYITCGLGLNKYLAAELDALGYEITSETNTALVVEGSLIDAMLLNLHLRSALNVFYQLDEFECTHGDQLYGLVKELPWENIIPTNSYFSVTSRVETRSVTNTMYPNLRVKDAVVDRINDCKGERPDCGSDRHRIVLYLFWKDKHAALYLNTSGKKISDRGYRKMPHKAPLRENLAWSIIYETGYDGSVPFIAPMCGSGTLAIEAALVAARRVPGLLRDNFCFNHLIGFDNDLWQNMRLQAKKASSSSAKPAPIIATDIDEKAVEAARKNAMTAGVEHLIEFDVCDFAKTRIPGQPGIIALNPEYGERLGEIQKLEEVYSRIGDFFKQSCSGYKGYIFTGNMELAKKVGLKTKRKIPFYNADIECRLLEYELYQGTKKASKLHAAEEQQTEQDNQQND